MSERVETGVVQFDEDWPGVFIRGDNALGAAIELEELLDETGADNISTANLRALLAHLRGCNTATGGLTRARRISLRASPPPMETPALDELLNGDTVVIKDADIDARIALKNRARLELSRLKARPKVSVEEAEIVALCRDALFDVREEGPVRKGLVAIDQEKWQRAVAALNGEVVNEPVPDWCWSSLRREWFKR